jgi:hypothetical protein
MASISSTRSEVIYTLTLSENEARVIRTIVGSAVGDPNGPRKHASSIWDALSAAGIEPLGYMVGNEIKP